MSAHSLSRTRRLLSRPVAPTVCLTTQRMLPSPPRWSEFLRVLRGVILVRSVDHKFGLPLSPPRAERPERRLRVPGRYPPREPLLY